MDSLEKEVSVLRERLAKKQVDIKEITVKKATPSGTYVYSLSKEHVQYY